MLTILISTLTILALIICSMSFLLWRLSSRECRSCQMLQSFLAEEKALSRILLGISEHQTPPTSPPTRSARSPQPEPDPLRDFEALSPEMQDVLMREYSEFMSRYPKNTTVHPGLEQITPGQPIAVSSTP